jgi:hypothetical protein
MPKLLPSQLSDEEILALFEAEDSPEPVAEIFEYKDDIVPFLSFYQITPGDTPVKKKLLYKLYKTYSKQPLDELNFNVQAGNYLAPSNQYYHINIDTFAISKQIYEAEKKRDKTKSLSYQKHFNWFMEQARVERGRQWIEGFILFYIYKDFCKQRRVHPKLGYVNFHKFLKLHFQYRRVSENRALWFRVDEKTATTFSEEDCDKIRAARAKAPKKARGSEEESIGETKESTPK